MFFLHSHENQSKFIWYNGWVDILMFSLVSRKFLAMRNITLYSVHVLQVATSNSKKNSFRGNYMRKYGILIRSLIKKSLTKYTV